MSQSSAGGSVYDVTPSQLGGLGSTIGLSTTVVKDDDLTLPGGSPWGLADSTILQVDRLGGIGWTDPHDVAQTKFVRVRKAPAEIADGVAEGGWYNRTGKTVKAGQWYVQVSGLPVYGDTFASTRALAGSTAEGGEGGWTWVGDRTEQDNDIYVSSGSPSVGSQRTHRSWTLVPDLLGVDQWMETFIVATYWSSFNLSPVLRHTLAGESSYFLQYEPIAGSPQFMLNRRSAAGVRTVLLTVDAVGMTAGTPVRFEVTGQSPVIIRLRIGSGRWHVVEDSHADRVLTGTRAGFTKTQSQNPNWGSVRFGALQT